MKSLKNGIIYPIFNLIINIIKYLNIVEYFKILAKKIFKKNRLTVTRISVDIYIIFKWIFVIIIWSLNINNSYTETAIWYLIVTNLFTYFYYHTWSIDNNLSKVRIKRRFLNLLQAILFNILCFTYLYAVAYNKEIICYTNDLSQLDYVLLSLSKALTLDFAYINQVTMFLEYIFLLETLSSFIFLTVILSNSIPQTKEKK